MQAHHIISIENASVGMALAKDLLDRQGNILLPVKAVLTASMIAALMRHHIDEITVLADAADSDAPEPQFNLATKLARIDHLFRTHENEAINMQLKNYIINYFTANHHGQD